MALADFINNPAVEDVEFLRGLVAFATQRLMEWGVAQGVGGKRSEPS